MFPPTGRPLNEWHTRRDACRHVSFDSSSLCKVYGDITSFYFSRDLSGRRGGSRFVDDRRNRMTFVLGKSLDQPAHCSMSNECDPHFVGVPRVLTILSRR